MKILVCSPVIPYPATSGLKIRVFNLARQLAREDQVHLFCLSEEPATESQKEAVREAGLGLTVVSKPANSLAEKLSIYARRMAGGVPPEFILSWERDIFTALARLGREGFDVAVAEHLFMARYSLVIDCPRVLLLHNIESDLARALAATYPQPQRAFKRATAAWSHGYEKRMLSRMQGAVTVTLADRQRLSRMAPALPAAVVENGVDCSSYRELLDAPREAAHRLLYIGLMSYESNIDAVGWFAREALPLIRERYPDTVFTIAGGDPAPAVRALAALDGVEVTGFVEDVRPLYRGHDMLVVPLRHGGGSRLKILEAFAAGTPVVSTSKGAEGLAAVDGSHLLIADDPAAMAAAVRRLFDDPALADALREEAARLAADRYDWPRLAGALRGFLSGIAGRP